MHYNNTLILFQGCSNYNLGHLESTFDGIFNNPNLEADMRNLTGNVGFAMNFNNGTNNNNNNINSIKNNNTNDIDSLKANWNPAGIPKGKTVFQQIIILLAYI